MVCCGGVGCVFFFCFFCGVQAGGGGGGFKEVSTFIDWFADRSIDSLSEKSHKIVIAFCFIIQMYFK